MNDRVMGDMTDTELDALDEALAAIALNLSPGQKMHTVEKARAALRELRAKLDRAVEALQAIDVCECQYARDPLRHALYAIVYCQKKARTALREIEEEE